MRQGVQCVEHDQCDHGSRRANGRAQPLHTTLKEIMAHGAQFGAGCPYRPTLLDDR